MRPSQLKTLCALMLSVLCLLCQLGAVQSALAAYPDKAIKVVIPFSPGGGTDLIGRTFASGLAEQLGQPVIVDNKPGAGTIVGTDFVAKSAPDGYTLVVATFAHAVNPSMMQKLPYSFEKSFAPVVMIGKGPNVLVVNASSPYKTVQDILNAAKQNPGKLSYASQGNGTSAHLAGEMFSNLGKVKMTHIPYKGAGPALTDLLGSQVDMMFATASAVAGFVESGKLRAIAVTSSERSGSFKNVPTVGETIAGYSVESWYAVYAPAGTPSAVIDKLNAGAKRVIQSAEFRKKIEPEGLITSPGTPEELDVYVHKEEQKWRKIVLENGIKID